MDFWTDEKSADLRKLWRGPLSTAQIGRLLGASSSAVGARAMRMGLGRKPIISTGPVQPVPRAEPKVRGVPGEKARISFAALDGHHCRAIPGRPSPAAFAIGSQDPVYCGLSAVPGSSYCREHAALYANTTTVKPRPAALPIRHKETVDG